ncbi:two-component sensor histidine kinase [Micromonospora globispora]|uniref:Sensor-like histidine kinase SenX3 n=1 Tax=Micromonospora globispora TaxID=1450148 RepID=A0A317JZK9_9ACTN|nr:two-component sensor histidine kinase [Micromonospora globispora]PWU56332.1 two-component sensor histidine kinase [Micromonospora globispora]RQW97905.1 two-component sensor histidine kinase [Micromonospora globispora]
MAVVVAVALVTGLVAGLLLAGPVREWRRRWTPPGSGRSRGRAGRPGIPDDQQGGLTGLGRKTIDSLRAGVVVLDPDDEPVLVNPAARALGLLRTGATPGSIAAHPLIRTLAGQVRRTGVRREIELDLPRGRDSVGDNPLGVHLRAMGIGAGYISIEAADVTESHRLARVRRDFVANVSHELKTPIGALQLLAEALLDATEPAGEGAPDLYADLVAARRFAERIQHESTRLGRLVQELLELTRLQGAEPQPPPEPVAVDWVIAEVVDRTRTAATARRIDVVIEGERGLTVYGSDRQIATAVANLVENAINYSGEDTTVRVTTRKTDEYVDIAVADQGIGIAPNEVDRIFERFYRADRARSRATGGTGLGLAIVKHIASNHGGRVDVASTLGGGSTFTLRLPTSPPDDLEATLASAEIEAGPAELRQV